MKGRLLPLALALALLAGCTPPPEPSPSTAPEPDPTPVTGMDFDAFLEEVNTRRKAVIETEAALDIGQWTPDFTDQNDTYTEEEMELLLTPHDLTEPLTIETAQEDIEAFFTLLRTTYGAYEYFGGDEVFGPLEEQALAQIQQEAEDGKILLSRTIQDILVDALSPIVRDGHFTIGEQSLIESHRVYLYYVPGLYLSDAEGLDPNYVKPTIGPEGQICYGFYALSQDGTDLPDTLGDYDLDWTQAERATRGSEVFSEYSYQDIPVLRSAQMYASTPEQEAQLERFAACGGEYADEPVLIFDVRANPGGSDRWIMNWFEGFTGQPAQPKRVFSARYSQMFCRAFDFDPENDLGTWMVSEDQGTWTPSETVTLLLADKGTASSGETVVEFFRSMENVLAIGGPTSGCALVPNNSGFYLPNTGLYVYFGTGLAFHETMDNWDGMGYLPDLWVNPPDALDAAARLCDYYGLK
ncbi:S41 family peptidase [uncultured Flavonifractor sp.]|uniref:S41 family peptidase n=1 Tax=uncultured Flavonifractor sp. TaxID=1193534 RepID=UPI00261B0DB9|nr:S41 family peptidase [uncultured Flavonifractor sp.]